MNLDENSFVLYMYSNTPLTSTAFKAGVKKYAVEKANVNKVNK